nr:MAG TPA: hypothetical protein [Caudoviricetes sp.]
MLIRDTLNLYQYSHLIDIQAHHSILVIRDLEMCSQDIVMLV